MRAEIGALVVTGTGFDYLVLIVTGRTPNTIATTLLNGSTRDQRAMPRNFRAYDEAKVNRLLQLDKELKERRQEQQEIYQSLERIE